MLEFCSLSSGSSGNSSVLRSGQECLLIDAGISLRKIETHLREQGIEPEQITRLLITHAHTDHAKSARIFACKYKVPVYLSRETLQTLRLYKGEDFAGCEIRFLKSQETFAELQVKTYRLPHLGTSPDGRDDAGGTIGFLFAKGGKRIGYFTDLGTMPEHIIKDIHDCDFLFLEANHDVHWQKSSGRPAHIIERNLSDFGHLSNEQAAQVVERVVKKDGRTQAVMLAHISRDCNSHELIKKAMRKILPENFDKTKILFALEGRSSQYIKV